MNRTVLIQIEPEELTDIIKESVRSEISKFKNDLINKSSFSQKDDSEEGELVSLKRAEQIFFVKKTTIYNWRKQNKLPNIYRKGRRVYFKKNELMACLESNSTK